MESCGSDKPQVDRNKVYNGISERTDDLRKFQGMR